MSGLGILAVAGGILAVFAVFGLVFYVIGAIAISKALKAVEYKYPWFAWFPVLNIFALSDAAFDNDEDAKNILFNKVSIPKEIAKFWFILYVVLMAIPKVGSYLAMIVMILVMGPAYALLYAKIEQKTLEDTRVLGYVSAFIPIIPVFKWLGIKLHKEV